jgi:hypothetical protein
MKAVIDTDTVRAGENRSSEYYQTVNWLSRNVSERQESRSLENIVSGIACGVKANAMGIS